MRLESLPFALAFLSSPLLAQSDPIVVVEPSEGPIAQVIVRPFTVQTVEPNFRFELKQPIVTTISPRSPFVTVEPRRLEVRSPLVLRNSSKARIVASADGDGPREGEVWLGLSLMARKDGAERLEVVEVLAGSPAERAGVQAGDKLVALSGHGVATHKQLLEVLRGHHAGERLSLTVERATQVELGRSSEDEERAFLGVSPGSSSGDAPGRRGTTVDGITQGSAAARAGLAAGSRIAAIDGDEINSFEELQKAIQSHDPGESIELRIQRDIAVELAPRPGKDESGRTVTGTGRGAFSEPMEPPVEEEHGHAEKGSSADKKLDFFWKTPEEPKAKEPHAGAPDRPVPQQRAPRDSQPEPRGQRRSPGLGAQQELSAQLLEEIRSLRAEVADLRREIEVLRERRR